MWATRARPLVLALGSVWMTAFGPATEMNTYAVLAGVAAYLVVAPGPRPRWAAAAAWAGYGLLAASVLRAAFPDDWRFQVLGPQPAGALLLAAAAVGGVAAPADAAPWVWAARVTGRLRAGKAEGREVQPHGR